MSESKLSHQLQEEDDKNSEHQVYGKILARVTREEKPKGDLKTWKFKFKDVKKMQAESHSTVKRINETFGRSEYDLIVLIDAGILEYDSNVKTKIDPILALNHTTTAYEPINKDFYEEVESISAMSEQETLDYRQILGIRVSGFDVHRPVKTFKDHGFSSQIMSAIKKQAYEKPTAILCQALPILLPCRDVIGVGKTGSGKTAAFVLPMIVHIMDQPELQKNEGPIGVICVLTRELTHQIFLEAKKFSKAYGLRFWSKQEQFKELKAGYEIVAATPKRLIDMLKIKDLTMMRASYLVLDEANRMFVLGFELQVRFIASQIHSNRQTLLFSATIHWKVEKLAREILSSPIRIRAGEVGIASEDITQVVNVISSNVDKLPWLLENPPEMIDEGGILVFASKKPLSMRLKPNKKLK